MFKEYIGFDTDQLTKCIPVHITDNRKLISHQAFDPRPPHQSLDSADVLPLSIDVSGTYIIKKIYSDTIVLSGYPGTYTIPVRYFTGESPDLTIRKYVLSEKD